MQTLCKRAVIYCRVSTKEQVEEGNSLTTQEKLCKEYALKNGYDIAHFFIEQGESAKTQDRTQLQNLLSFCAVKRNEVKAVITYKIDRISRNTDDYSQIRILLKRYGVEIKSTSEFFENTPAGRFMENIIANVAQFDNDVRTERSVGGMRDAMREGRYVWLAPAGYDNTRIAGKASIIPNQLAPLILKTFEEIAKNISPVIEVHRQMTIAGLTTNKGKAISKGYFYRLLKNELYAGWIKKFGERHKGLFQPIISEELFVRVQRVLTQRRHRGFEYQWENPDFPLRRFVFHPNGKKLTGSWSKGRSKSYPYYRFSTPGMQIKKADLENGYKVFLQCFEFNEDKYSKLKLQVKENLLKKTEEKRKENKKLMAYLDSLKEKQTSIIQKNIKGFISDEVLKQQCALVEQETLDTQSAILKMPTTEDDIEDALEFASHYLRKPSEVWEKASVTIQRQLQWFQFPQGITYDGEKIGTNEVSNLFNAKDFFLGGESPEVHFKPSFENRKSKGPIPPRRTVVTCGNSRRTPIIKESKLLYWERMEKDLLKLGKIMKENADSSEEKIGTSDNYSLHNRHGRAA